MNENGSKREAVRCHDCGADCPAPAGGTGAAGYAVRHCDGARICYACSDKAERIAWRETKPGQRFACYLNADGSAVASWPGGILARVTGERTDKRRTPSGGRSSVPYLRAVDADGRQWHGRAMGRGMLARMAPRTAYPAGGYVCAACGESWPCAVVASPASHAPLDVSRHARAERVQ